MLAPLVLPSQLTGAAEQLTKAVREVEVLGEWPGGPFCEAAQPKAIAKALIAAIHGELVDAHIAYLFCEDIRTRDRIVLGKAARAASVLGYLSGFDFVLRFNWTAWGPLTPPQRIALVDHELAHCTRDDKGAYSLLSHDVEEFASIVQRWGLWKPDLVQFNAAIQNSQYNLWHEGEKVTGVTA